MRDKFTKTEKSWMLYDWANSVFATNIMTALFPIYFGAICQANGQDNLVLWSIGTSIATFTIALLAPFLGALGDHKGYKKKLFSVFLSLGVLATLYSAFTDNYIGLLIGYVLGYIGYLGANLFYDSFLTDVTTKDRMDRVSSWGYAMGYLGGSTIPFIGCIVILLVMGMDNPLAMKVSIVVTALWWFIFSIPLLKNVKQIHYIEKSKSNVVVDSFKNLYKTFKDIFRNKKIFFFILAYFFYIDGVNTIITVATSYGTALKLDSVGMILAVVVTQVVAVPCSILFGRLTNRFKAISMLKFAIIVYFFITLIGAVMGIVVEIGQGSKESVNTAQTIFWILAFMIGTVQGGIQALSRSYFGKLIPAERSNEFFGFFDIFGKFAAVLGPVLISTATVLTGYEYIGVLSLSMLFILGFVFLGICKKYSDAS